MSKISPFLSVIEDAAQPVDKEHEQYLKRTAEWLKQRRNPTASLSASGQQVRVHDPIAQGFSQALAV